MNSILYISVRVTKTYSLSTKEYRVVQFANMSPGIHFFVNIGKFGLLYFREVATDFPETLQVN